MHRGAVIARLVSCALPLSLASKRVWGKSSKKLGIDGASDHFSPRESDLGDYTDLASFFRKVVSQLNPTELESEVVKLIVIERLPTAAIAELLE